MRRSAKIWLVAGILVVVLLCCCIVSVAGVAFYRSVFNTTEIVDLVTSGGNPNVTLANYNRVQIGMTYQEVVDVFGGPGVRSAQVTVAGKRLEFYSWMDTAGGQTTVVFKEGRVTKKSEDGLR
jgi:hypothetical protein